jgi:hypothetical protein
VDEQDSAASTSTEGRGAARSRHDEQHARRRPSRSSQAKGTARQTAALLGRGVLSHMKVDMDDGVLLLPEDRAPSRPAVPAELDLVRGGRLESEILGACVHAPTVTVPSSTI